VWLTSEADDQSSFHCVRPIVSTDSAGASKQRGGAKRVLVVSGHMASAEDRDAEDVEEMGNGEGVYIYIFSLFVLLGPQNQLQTYRRKQ